MLALLFPLLGALGPLALPDVPLTFAAALALWSVLRLYERVSTRDLVWLAVALVVGALSHYRFALLAIVGGMGLLFDPRGRRLLRDPRLWIAAGIGALAWLPLLWWNLAHGATGIAFQFSERHPWQLHAEGAWLPLSQLVVVSPLLLVAMLAGFGELRRRVRGEVPGPARWLIVAAALPMSVYLALAFFADRERVSFHWLLQAWLPLLLVAPVVMSGWRKAWRVMTCGLAACGLVGILGYASVAAIPSLRSQLADSRWYPDNFAGWHEISDVVRRIQVEDPGAVPIADNFMLGAQLAFALRDPRVRMLDHPLNHKHGRSAQIAQWGLVADLDAEPGERWLVMEDSATPLRLRLQRYHAMCRDAGALSTPASIEVDHGRKRFLIFDRASFRAGACVLPAIAWIDSPAAGSEVGAAFEVRGWAFKDGVGIAAVDVLIDGKIETTADYGVAVPHVAEFWKTSGDPAHPQVGFKARVELGGIEPGAHWLGLRLHGRDGSIETWPEQRIIVRR